MHRNPNTPPAGRVRRPDDGNCNDGIRADRAAAPGGTADHHTCATKASPRGNTQASHATVRLLRKSLSSASHSVQSGNHGWWLQMRRPRMMARLDSVSVLAAAVWMSIDLDYRASTTCGTRAPGSDCRLSARCSAMLRRARRPARGAGMANICTGGPITSRLGGPCLSSSSNPLVCSRVSFRPIDSLGINGMNSVSIWQPPANNDALMSPFTATRSRAWAIDSASTIAEP